jgi:hypothetical protein
MRMRRRHGCIAQLFGLLVFCVAIAYGVAAITAPWSFHIAGLSTPLLYWSASGMLHSKGGTYPLYVLFYPSPNFSRLRADGLRPTGGVQGSASLCTSRGVIRYLKLSGTIYNGWLSTEGSLIGFRLVEPLYFDVGQKRGYVDLSGRWNGPQLVMDDRASYARTFSFGTRIENASVTLDRASYSDFKAACAAWSGL